MLRSSGTAVQHSTHNPKMECSNPAPGTEKDEMAFKKLQVLNNSKHVPILTKPMQANVVFEEG